MNPWLIEFTLNTVAGIDGVFVGVWLALRDLQLSIAGAAEDNDPELAAILEDGAERLRDLFDEQRLNGILLITDFGEPVHKRLLGLKTKAS